MNEDFESTQESAAAPQATDAAAPAFVEGTPVIGLEEFCMRLSQSDRRVEMIAAFHYTEKAAGRLRDNEASYQSRYEDFINKPV